MIISSTSYSATQSADLDVMLNSAALQSFGMPDERLARVAARRAFVEMKLRFMQAAKDVPGQRGQSLARRVRSSAQAIELWRLRDELFSALALSGERQGQHQQELRRQLSGAFLA